MATRGECASAFFQQLDGIWEEDNKIVVGIDIGTTQSGVALTYLERGQKREIHRIAKWPGQGEQDQRSKVPTVVWYDPKTKKAMSFGAEALSHDTLSDAVENGWFLAKYFKLHLQPKELRKAEMKLDPLPPEISLAQIYSDFLGYLLKHTKAFIEKRMALGKQIWERYGPTMEVVIAHPNGWDTPEQDFLRKAAINSGFVDSDKAATQVRFVTEAEASVHYCIHHSNLSKRLQTGANLAVCDAGGSTVDTTLYSIVSTSPVLQLREARMSDSIQAGGILVNMEFERFMREELEKLGLPQTQVDEFTTNGAEDFENFSKRNFGSESDGTPEPSTVSERPVLIRLAPTSFSFGPAGTSSRIHRGCMKVPRSIIKGFFDVCARPILSSVDDQLKSLAVQHVLLVGGFGDSPYLHSEFERHYGSGDCEVVLANDFTSKAVAEGAVIWNTLCSVVSRTPRSSFGGIPIDAEELYRETFSRFSPESNPYLISLSTELYSYSGDDEPTWAWDVKGKFRVIGAVLPPRLYWYRWGIAVVKGDGVPHEASSPTVVGFPWPQIDLAVCDDMLMVLLTNMLSKENLLPGFQKVCTITAELYNLEGSLKMQMGLLGNVFWQLKIDVCIRFGTTELQAHLEWEQNGVKRQGPAVVVPGRPIDI
ncbi:unnamed protein product [Rhizoctonia solani]|uniref:Uncharacterized protein n=1 Tax=Rhizoctonia solani TaxID=456999 RepID=A0A8H3C2M0_9AGAM|nr:unnamed protein product [Rhizoctonia solani]